MKFSINQIVTLNKGLIYTEVLGWIDLGHARGSDIRNLLDIMARGESSGNEFYDVRYSQGMTGFSGQVRSGKMITWQIKRGRSYFERQQIALAMMMTMARRFETFQSSFPNNLVTDSSFSGEDLVSDLLGFYRVVSVQSPFGMLKPVSKSNALKRWDHYGKIGNWKNDSFQPLLFPDPERCPNSRPYKGQLPPFMKKIQPYNNFSSDNVIRSRKNDKTFIIPGAGNNKLGL